MAGVGNGQAIEDEESGHVGNKVQPLSSTTKGLEEWEVGEDRKKDHTCLRQKLGFDEFFALKVWRESLGELVGTAVFVFSLDAIVISSYHSKTSSPNLIMSCLIAITVAILLLATNPISGGHLNPAITLGAAFLGIVSLSRALIYIVAQCIGAIIGAFALKAVVNSAIEENFSLGGCTLTVIIPGPNGPLTMGLEKGQAFWLEIICTFVLLFASIWIAFDHRQAKALGRVIVFLIIGIVVGLLVFVSTTLTGTKGYAGAGMNPARCLGPAVVRGGNLWNDHWIFWAGPGIACLVFYVYLKMIPRQHYQAQGYKHDIFDMFKTSFKHNPAVRK